MFLDCVELKVENHNEMTMKDMIENGSDSS